MLTWMPRLSGWGTRTKCRCATTSRCMRMCTSGCGTHSPRWTRTGAEPYVARRRLDAELVRRNLARSREHARRLIAAARVPVGGATATKPATQVETSAALVVAENEDEPDYVSRGGHKLA